MGRFCPEGCGFQPQKRVITASFGPAVKASDVMAIELGCGHQLGGEEFAAYDKARKEIILEAAKKRMEMDRETNAKLAAAFKDLRAKKGAV